MSVAIIKADVYKCERCGHVWLPRSKGKEKDAKTKLPIACAKCKSAYWNRPKESKK